jgi:hypothetical protein
MIKVVWEFHVKPEHVQEFEVNYSGSGAWSELFRSSPAYRGTVLARDRENRLRFFTIDTWDDFPSYEKFRVGVDAKYRELDRNFERFADAEKLVGLFEVL